MYDYLQINTVNMSAFIVKFMLHLYQNNLLPEAEMFWIHIELSTQSNWATLWWKAHLLKYRVSHNHNRYEHTYAYVVNLETEQISVNILHIMNIFISSLFRRYSQIQTCL